MGVIMKLYENEDFLSFSGALGRYKYFWLGIKIFCIGLLISIIPIAFIISAYRNNYYPDNTLLWIGYITGGILLIYCSIVGLSALVRRIRDIRGTTENEGYWLLGYLFITMSIATSREAGIIFSLPLSLFIFLKRGVISESNVAIPLENIFKRIEREFIDTNSSITFSENDANSFDDKKNKLEELFQLKNDGALTEDEYQAEKSKILSK